MLRGAVAVFLIAAFLSVSPPQAFGADPVSIRFDITEYRVDGSTLLSNRQIQVAPFRGKQRDFADIQRALKALTQATPVPPGRGSSITRPGS